jgi:predicted  nucleic acid-binding Zn-ribbon protein
MATKKETKVIEEGQQVLFVKQEQPLQQDVIELQNKIVELQNKLFNKEHEVNPLQSQVITLEKKIAETESVIKQLNEQVKDLSKTRDALTQQVFDNDKAKIKIEQEHNSTIEALKKQFELAQKEHKELSQKFNSLAALFDEHIKGADDMVELSRLILRNNLRTQELLQQKIKAFNGEGDKK